MNYVFKSWDPRYVALCIRTTMRIVLVLIAAYGCSPGQRYPACYGSIDCKRYADMYANDQLSVWLLVVVAVT